MENENQNILKSKVEANKEKANNVSPVEVKPIKKVEIKPEYKVPKMVAIAIDGYGNRIFCPENKVEQKKKKLGLKN